MPEGLPETEVFAAADRVLARGERPTVERVSTELGRGSPARVGQLLEVWWDASAKRLAGHAALPGLPAAVAGAFAQLWEQAVNAGRTAAEQEVRPSAPPWRASCKSCMTNPSSKRPRSRKPSPKLPTPVRQRRWLASAWQTWSGSWHCRHRNLATRARSATRHKCGRHSTT